VNICGRSIPVEKTHITQNIYPGIICILLKMMSAIQNITVKRLDGSEHSLRKSCRRKKSWPNLRHGPGVCLKILKINTINLSQNGKTHDPGLEKAPPEYMSEASPFEPAPPKQAVF
jgi:hypothetical protein